MVLLAGMIAFGLCFYLNLADENTFNFSAITAVGDARLQLILYVGAPNLTSLFSRKKYLALPPDPRLRFELWIFQFVAELCA